MKSNTKFFAGLSLGLLFGFLVFSAGSFFSQASEVDGIQKSDAGAGDGEWITVQAANTMIDAYKTNFIQGNNLPENTTLGGTISKSQLKDVAARSSDESIKFRFYLSNTEGQPKIGIAFFPKRSGETALITNSFCPQMCE